MERKFSIFVVLLSLAQNCLTVSEESPPYGLSKDQLAIFEEILSNQEGSVQAKFDAFNPVFDILEESACGLIWGQRIESTNTTSTVAEALGRAEEAFDYSANSILLGLGKSFSIADNVKAGAYKDLADVFTLVSEALELANTGKYHENRAGIDELQSAAEKDFEDLTAHLFGEVPTWLNTTDEDILATINTAATGSKDNLIKTINAVFNGIKVYAVAVSAGMADISLLSAIENCRSYALIRLRNVVEFEAGLIKTIFLMTQLNLDVPASDLYSIQYTQTVSTYRFQAAIDAIYETIADHLRTVAIGFFDVGQSEFSSADVAKAVTFANVEASLRVLENSVVEIDLDASAAAADAWKWFVNFSNNLSDGFYSAIATTKDGTTLSDVQGKINELKESKGLSGITHFVVNISELIQNNKTYGDDVKTEIVNIRNEQIAAFTNFVSEIYNGVHVLANITFGTEDVSEDYAMETFQNAAYSSIGTLTYKIAELHITTLLGKILSPN